jgi:peptide deformylase
MRRPWAKPRDRVRVFDDAVLRAPVRDVTDFGVELQQLVERLLRVQKRNHAIGVAATQIGESWNVFVINGAEIRSGGKSEVYVNPRIVSTEGTDVDEEGCLSFPGIFIPISRPFRVALTAQDVDGAHIEREATGLLARAYSHETDHLLGQLIIDRVAPGTRERIIEKMKRRSSRRANQP